MREYCPNCGAKQEKEYLRKLIGVNRVYPVRMIKVVLNILERSN